LDFQYLQGIMRQNLLKIAALIVLGLSTSTSLKAQGGVAIYGGLSTPNDQLGNVYNDNTTFESLPGNADLGYHFGARYRMPLAASFMLSGGVAWNRFPESEVYIMKPGTNDTLGGLATVNNIVPVSVGLDYVIFNKGLGMFVGGELAYNYISATTELIYGGNTIPYEKEETQNRVGGGVGLGVFFDAKIATAIVDVKYNVVNLIGKEENEESKNYVTLSLGLMLGGM
jgi:hypothetical protein